MITSFALLLGIFQKHQSNRYAVHYYFLQNLLGAMYYQGRVIEIPVTEEQSDVSRLIKLGCATSFHMLLLFMFFYFYFTIDYKRRLLQVI